jgi:pimeloyl-ACP methyl ester carboxylesterase
MAVITVDRENSTPIDLYYEDHGSGDPVVLIHGWPLSGRSWEKQVPALVGAGYRVITYDRRGFGESSKPWTGYEYDTLARDLDRLMNKLDLRNVTLVGFSMGGGEVARYLGTYGAGRVHRAAFVAAVTPYLLKAADNPAGVDLGVFDGIRAALNGDRLAFLSTFFQNFYNADVLRGTRLSDDVLRLSWTIAAGASPKGTHEVVAAWGTDFRADLARITVPTLIVHGDADRIVPLEVAGWRMPALVKGSRLLVIKGGSHGLSWTHAEELNQALLEFIGTR